MSILIALVIAGIILIMVASVNDATISIDEPTATAIVVSPLAIPANNVVGDTVVGVPEQVNDLGPSSGAIEPCAGGCMLDNMCGNSESIIARMDPEGNTRYYYTPGHPQYTAFRSAETQGQTNYYFCTPAQAEAEGWRQAP